MKTKRYVTPKFDIHARLTPEEYGYIQKWAEKKDCSISQVIRFLLFKHKTAQIKDTDFDKKMLDLVKKKVSHIETLVNRIGSFQDAENTKINVRILSDILKISNEIKGIVEKYYADSDSSDSIKSVISEDENTIKSSEKTSINQSESNNKIIKFFYMQKISLCGKITAEPKIFPAKNGIDMVAFTVGCLDEKDQSITNFDVYMTKQQIAEIFNMLTLDRQVMLSGTLKFREALNKKGNIQNQLAVRADNLILGQEKI